MNPSGRGPKNSMGKGVNREHSILTPRQAAQYLHLHIVTLYRLLKKGQIPGTKIGGQWRFEKVTLDNWLMDRIQKQLTGK